MKFTPRTLLLGTYFILYLIFLAILTWPLLLFRYFKANTISDAIFGHAVGFWGRSMLWVTGSRYTVYGKENQPDHNRVLLLSNHQGHFDGPLIVGTWNRLIGAVSKKELEKFPIFRHWIALGYSPFIDRKNREESIAKINQRIKDINKGWPLLMFPEGTRSKTNEINLFKRGGLGAVLKSGVLVLPITVANTYKVFEAKQGAITPTKDLSITYHKTIDTSKLDQDDVEGFALMLEEIMNPMKQKHLNLS